MSKNKKGDFMDKNKAKLVLTGGAVGLINGFMGGGGGIFVVLALTLIVGMQQKYAHATAILIILPVSVVSAIVYIAGGNVNWLMTLFSTIGVVTGGIVGAFALKKINDKWLRLVFSVILLLAGVRMFF
ncbi:MAG: sulfite exporter TauE/SafE family protein [Clostridiales bacterium]|nr:sulfite exporter TauE/SafE family protein [Clostridiales bacterium]